ncbi:MAG: type II toxin-antitoxin system HicB family antitoxin [Actinomycetota bacterium]|nr:type II toxin-antitoxin system HicB family antitoxin [Actinomycetota bacterium]
MEESIEDYLALCEEVGKEPERPYRGEFLVRTTPEIHRAVASAAEAEGMSLNAWVETAITGVVDQRQTTPTQRTQGSKRSKAKRKKSPAGRSK